MYARRVKCGAVLPVGMVTFSKLPKLYTILERFVLVRKGQPSLFQKHGSPSDSVGRAMLHVCERFGIHIPVVQSHMFRRGTASALEALGVPLFVINQHLGWSPSS